MKNLETEEINCTESMNLKKPLIDRVRYELRKYTDLAIRMDELIYKCDLDNNYASAMKAAIKRDCYNKFVHDLKLLID